MGTGPRRLNVVSLALLGLLAVAGYAAYLLLPLYSLAADVDHVLDESKYEAAELDPYGGNNARDLLLGRIFDRLVALGIDDEQLIVYVSDEGDRLHADYEVVVTHPLGQTTTFDFERSIEIPSQN